MPGRLSQELERLLAGEPDAVLDVVLELEGPAGPPDIEGAKEEFRRLAAPVIAEVRAHGGEVVGEAWLNQTLLARVPPAAIGSLVALEQVSLVDVPHGLQAE